MRKGLIRHIVSFIIVGSIGGYAYYEYSQTQQKKDSEVKKTYFLKKKFSQLSEIKIVRGKEVLLLSRKDQNWFMKKPIKDHASFSEVSRWFDEIQNQKVKKISIEGDIFWKDYYLEKSPRVNLKFLNKETFSFYVSSKSSFDDKYFIRKDDQLFLGEMYFSNEINSKKFEDFRSKNLIPSYGHATKIKIKGTSLLTFDWNNYRWFFKDKRFPLNLNRLDQFWRDLSSIEAQSIKGKANTANLKKYKLDQARYQIDLFYGKNKKVIIKISGFKQDKIYVHSSHRNYILEISKEQAKKLQLFKHDIRDHNQPFRYSKQKASRLDIQSKKVTYSIKIKNQKWMSLSSPDKKIDLKKVDALLNSIYELRGERYRNGKLKNADAFIAIKDDKKNILFDLKADTTSSSLVWIQTNFSQNLVGISKNKFQLILNKDIYLSSVNKK